MFFFGFFKRKERSKMRKFVSAIICLAVLFSFCAYGYAANSAIIYGNDVICANGEIISVPVSIKNNLGIMGFRISVCYPEEALSVEKVEYGEITKKGMFADNISENTNGIFDVVWSNSAASTNDGTIFVITFNVSETATTGDYTISLSYSPDDTFDEKWNDVILNSKEINVHIDGLNPKINQNTILKIKDFLQKFIAKIKELLFSLTRAVISIEKT